MISTSKLFESSITPGQLFKSSGKLIGAGVGLGLSGIGKTLDNTGRKVHDRLTSNSYQRKNIDPNHPPVVSDTGPISKNTSK